MSNFFANRTIMNVSEKVNKLHIIDFGILFGFRWPCFLQRLSNRPGGSPKLRITGIDFPCQGFRPSIRVEETGRRLAGYADTFKVPFEFHAIAQKWETIKLEDLRIEEDEMVAVSSLFNFKNLLDETVVVNSPRSMVLKLIRKMNPAVFVLGIKNGAYYAPFFITRFREALFHYSSLFDMVDVNEGRVRTAPSRRGDYDYGEEEGKIVLPQGFCGGCRWPVLVVGMEGKNSLCSFFLEVNYQLEDQF